MKESSAEEQNNDYEQLLQAAAILREMGFTVIDFVLDQSFFEEAQRKRLAFPVVREGADGIRVSPTRDGLRLWFTNGFEDPENSRRKEVIAKLQEAGLNIC